LSACLVGAGEFITRSALARVIGEALEISDEDANAHNILHQILLDRFWSGSFQNESSSVAHNSEAQLQERDANPNVGVLLLTKEQTDSGQSIRQCKCFGYAKRTDLLAQHDFGVLSRQRAWQLHTCLQKMQRRKYDVQMSIYRSVLTAYSPRSYGVRTSRNRGEAHPYSSPPFRWAKTDLRG
jgi:hypothetical protein